MRTMQPMNAQAEEILEEEIMHLVEQGRKIQAIKLYRQLHGVGLKEAKQSIEEMIIKKTAIEKTPQDVTRIS